MRWFLVVLMLYPGLSFGADFSACSEFVAGSSLAHAPFQIDSDGKVKLTEKIVSPESYNFSEGHHRFRLQRKDSVGLEYSESILVTYEGKQLKRIIHSTGKYTSPTNPIVYTYDFDAFNGLCFPVRKTEMSQDSSSTENRLRFDIKMCRDLIQLLQHPDLAVCSCGDSATDKKIGAVLAKYGVVVNPTEPKPAPRPTVKEVQNYIGPALPYYSDPIRDAISYVQECGVTPGVTQVLNNKEYWDGRTETATAGGSGGTRQ